MKTYYHISFKYAENIYCTNLAHAETAEDVTTYYSNKYEWVSEPTEATPREVETCKNKGMPVIEIDHTEPDPAEVDAVVAEAVTAEIAQDSENGTTTTPNENPTKDTTHTESGAESAEKRAQNMNTNTTNPTSPAAQFFPHLFAEIAKDTGAKIAELFCYVANGYYPSWAEEHRTNTDRGLQLYSTVTRWAQYQRGEISREKAVELATRRALKEVEKSHAANLARLERAAEVSTPRNLDIMVMWKKSRTWGANPTAEAMTETARTSGFASGCGYDKESAAIANALNQNPAALRVLYELGEAALARGESAASKTSCSGYSWGRCIGYGAGYSVLPYFEGGVRNRALSCTLAPFVQDRVQTASARLPSQVRPARSSCVHTHETFVIAENVSGAPQDFVRFRAETYRAENRGHFVLVQPYTLFRQSRDQPNIRQSVPLDLASDKLDQLTAFANGQVGHGSVGCPVSFLAHRAIPPFVISTKVVRPIASVCILW